MSPGTFMHRGGANDSVRPRAFAGGLALLTAILLLTAASARAAETNHDTSRLEPGALVASVLAHNAGLAALRAAVDAAEARIVPAGALPDAQFSGAVAPETIGGFQTPSGRNRSANLRLEISQELPWPGTLGLRSDVARKEAAATADSVAALRLRLAAATRSTFAQWRYVYRALDINAANQRLVTDLHDVAENRYAAGLGRQQDVLQAAVELQRLKHQAIKLRRLKRDVRAKINRLLTRSDDVPIAKPAELPAPSAIPSYNRLRAQAIASHPELTQIERQIAAGKDREALAHKAFYPNFKVFTGYNSLWDAGQKRWVVGTSVSLPLNRRKYRAKLDEAQAQTMRSTFKLQDQRAELLSELKQAYAAVEEASHSLTLYEKQLAPLAQANLSAARADYGASNGSFLDVMTAEEKKLNVDLNLESARADYFAARARLARWSGTGVDANPDPSGINLDVFSP